MISDDVVLYNIKVFTNLQKNQKMIVNTNNNLIKVDNSYLQSLTRTASRRDLPTPTKLTFDRAIELCDNGKLTIEEINVALDNLSESLKQTYPEFQEIHTLLEEIKNNLKKKRSVNDSEIEPFIGPQLEPKTNSIIDSIENIVTKYIIQSIIKEVAEEVSEIAGDVSDGADIVIDVSNEVESVAEVTKNVADEIKEIADEIAKSDETKEIADEIANSEVMDNNEIEN